MTADLERLVPPTITVMVGGESLLLSPVRLGQLPALVRAAAPIFDRLASGNVVQVLLEEPDAVLHAVQAATGIERARIDALALDEAVDLVAAVIELNADFFTRAVAPRIGAATARLAAVSETVAGGVGAMAMAPPAAGSTQPSA